MGVEWFKSPAGQQVIGLLADPRPAWLWSHDGTLLLWQNYAARIFADKFRRRPGKGLTAIAEPIRGQVARLLRLGSNGKSSLSRQQFLVAGRPVAATCRCTPLDDDNGRPSLLIVGIEPVEGDLFKDAEPGMFADLPLFRDIAGYLITDQVGTVLAGTPAIIERYGAMSSSGTLPDNVAYGPDTLSISTFKAGPGALNVVLFAPVAQTDPVIDRPALEQAKSPEPVDAEEISDGEPEAPGEQESAQPDVEAPGPERIKLSQLLDRLADDSDLFSPLGDDDELPEDLPETENALHATTFIPNDNPDQEIETEIEPVPPGMWKITGRNFTPSAADTPPADDAPAQSDKSPPTPETIERASRYNFDQLTRILTDRIGETNARPRTDKDDPAGQRNRGSDSLVNLTDETLVLNRMPLGLVIFRDQTILFANRFLTEFLGYRTSASLRAAGLAAIFPINPEIREPLGPVTHLAGHDGALIAVTARLQTITWQGKPAFMLSARREETHPGTEMAVRDFAVIAATTRNEGFFELSGAGIVASVSGRAAELFGRVPEILIGRSALSLIAHEDGATLRSFLDQPARFAGQARPSVALKGADRSLELQIFAQGHAGILTGYFGLVRRVLPATAAAATTPERSGAEADPALLARLGRGIRRPLNTIVGFSELIATGAFGPIENRRYTEYARDIRLSGLEIKSLIDELDEYARLREGRYHAEPVEFDLTELLDACVGRVRNQAGAARVLVRSAISHSLPHLKADRASLTQAVLNLLASAIDQTQEGGQVVLSAQMGKKGTIDVHVRDSAGRMTDLAERFVVFRDNDFYDGQDLRPMRSSVGLALTRSLLAVNECALTIDPTTGSGTIFSLTIPGSLAIAG